MFTLYPFELRLRQKRTNRPLTNKSQKSYRMESSAAWRLLAASATTTTTTLIIIIIIMTTTTTTFTLTSAQVLGTWAEADALEAEMTKDEAVTRLEEDLRLMRRKAKQLSDENDELVAQHEALTNTIREVKVVRISAEETIKSLEEEEVAYKEQLADRLRQEL